MKLNEKSLISNFHFKFLKIIELDIGDNSLALFPDDILRKIYNYHIEKNSNFFNVFYYEDGTQKYYDYIHLGTLVYEFPNNYETIYKSDNLMIISSSSSEPIKNKDRFLF